MTVAAFPSGIADGVYWLLATAVIVPLGAALYALHVKAEDRRERFAARALRRQDGQALIEYALIISLVALIAIVALKVSP